MGMPSAETSRSSQPGPSSLCSQMMRGPCEVTDSHLSVRPFLEMRKCHGVLRLQK